jgi:hypothetical protein
MSAFSRHGAPAVSRLREEHLPSSPQALGEREEVASLRSAPQVQDGATKAATDADRELADIFEGMLNERLAIRESDRTPNVWGWIEALEHVVGIARLRAARSETPGAAEILKLADERFLELRRAQSIIDGLKEYRERLLTCPMDIEPGGRARIRELASPPKDDYDRAVLLLAADHERLIGAVASPVAPAVRAFTREPQPTTGE